MLHILWILLKFILILLGILLGLILVAVLLILFCPVRYRASGTKETDSFRDISARARVSWLFGVVSFQLIQKKVQIQQISKMSQQQIPVVPQMRLPISLKKP